MLNFFEAFFILQQKKNFEMPENIKDYLSENSLLMYHDRFISSGYNDINQLLNMTSSEQ